MSDYQEVSSIIDVLSSHGQIERLEPDGKIHRFSKKRGGDECWYIATEHHGRKGTYVFCTWGDWSADTKEKLVQPPAGAKVNTRTTTRFFKEQAQEVEFAQKNKYEETSRKTLETFAAAPATGKSPYLERKGFPEVADPEIRFLPDCLLVPCRDRAGQLWGAQRIYPDGIKKFMPGQKSRGTFHTIRGETIDPLFITEGYATALSIHSATGGTVLVAFHCGNLTEVARTAKTLYPESLIAVCGDEDCWKGEKNPGREAAEAAAQAVGGVAILPEFEDVSTEPTDFNDLMLAQGLEAVKSQLMAGAAQHQQRVEDYSYRVRHREVDKRPANELATAIMQHHQVITDRNGLSYTYNGKHWEEVTDGQMKLWAAEVDAFEVMTDRRRSEIMKTVKVASTRKEIPWRTLKDSQIPFSNGIYNLDTEELTPHRPSHYLETVIPHKFSPDADCPTWKKCLIDWLGVDDVDKFVALQMFFGYVLMPHAKYKKGLMCYGPSNTGKSVVSQVLRELVGKGNYCNIPVEHMDDPRKRAPIKGKMVNIISELAHNALIADGGFKQLVSTQDTIEIDPKYIRPEPYEPFCKHTIFTNVLPSINDATDATYNRLLLIHFDKVIEEQDQDRQLLEKLRAEMEGIVLWSAIGAHMLHDTGGTFIVPKSSTETLREHKREQNPILVFLDEECQEEPSATATIQSVFTAFCTWHKGKNISNMSFTRMLRQSGIKTTMKDGVRMVMGYRLKSQGNEYRYWGS